MNLAIKDGAMWLIDVRAQFVFNLEEMERSYKENVDEH
jgi:hypothetical protein